MSGKDEQPGALFSTVRTSTILESNSRLDAKYYQESFTLAKARVAGCGLQTKSLEEIATAFVPGRLALITTDNSDVGAPYLRAHDAFDILPQSERYIVAERTKNYDSYLLKEGTILTPSSGRNLGPLAYVGRYLSQFAMSDIMRISPHNREDGFYLLAYLMTPTGQALVRRGRTGTTVDHLAPNDVLSIPVAWPESDVRKAFAQSMRQVQSLLDKARETILTAERELHEVAGLAFHSLSPTYYSSASGHLFTRMSSDLDMRLDAAYYEPLVIAAMDALSKSGACRLDEAADLRQLGRYKRYYVQKGRGRPILSGSHLTQLHPVNLQYISDRSFRHPERFSLKKGWTVFTCDGRAEESLAATAYVSSLWNEWTASNHVMRVIPKTSFHSGYLYLAMRSPFVQSQLKARATGNVVDALDIPTIADVLIPVIPTADRDRIGKKVEAAWEKVADGIRIEERTTIDLESLIVNAYETKSD